MAWYGMAPMIAASELRAHEEKYREVDPEEEQREAQVRYLQNNLCTANGPIYRMGCCLGLVVVVVVVVTLGSHSVTTALLVLVAGADHSMEPDGCANAV
jgi:hypothetical protein